MSEHRAGQRETQRTKRCTEPETESISEQVIDTGAASLPKQGSSNGIRDQEERQM